jgi:signal transduction histidine kinase
MAPRLGALPDALGWIARSYVRLLRWMMRTLGVSESLWRKIGVAVGIQYAGVLALAIVPTRVAGLSRTIWIGLLLLGTTLAVINTVIIIHQDIIEPIEQLESVGTTIRDGNLDVEPLETDQHDELGSLFHTTNEMIETLDRIETQAEAIRDQRFTEAVFEDSSAGEMGALIEDMRKMVQTHVRTIEEDRERYSLLNHLLTHDVANEVTVIEGFADQIEQVGDESVAQKAATIERAARNVEEIIEMARTLERDVSIASVDAVAILREEVEDVASTHPGAVVEGPDVEGPIQVQGNILLHAVFRNLLVNAIEHTPVATPVVRTSIEERADGVRIEVVDNGPGFDDPENAFEGADPGSGLDLIDRIVDQFDGTVEVLPAEGRGSTVRIELHRP